MAGIQRLGRDLARKMHTHTERPAPRGVSDSQVGGSCKHRRAGVSLNTRGHTSALEAGSYASCLSPAWPGEKGLIGRKRSAGPPSATRPN